MLAFAAGRVIARIFKAAVRIGHPGSTVVSLTQPPCAIKVAYRMVRVGALKTMKHLEMVA